MDPPVRLKFHTKAKYKVYTSFDDPKTHGQKHINPERIFIEEFPEGKNYLYLLVQTDQFSKL